MHKATMFQLTAILYVSGFALHSAQPVCLVAIIPMESHFQTALQGIRSELGDNYRIEVIDVRTPHTVNEAAATCKAANARALILMDSKAISLAQELQKYDTCFASMPKFVLMTLMAQWSARGLANAAGIQFEVPAYTLVTNFRIISKKDFRNVGVFYRKQFGGMIHEATMLLAREQITLHAVCVDCDRNNAISPSEALRVMNGTFDDLIKKKNIEVLWLLADNVLVNPQSLVQFWITKVKKRKVPVLAPLETLAGARIGAAVFAADPDIEQLGVQAANQITNVFEGGIPISRIGFESTISIKSTLNIVVARELAWALRQEKLARINNVIQK